MIMKRRSVSRGIEASQINKSVTPPIRNLMNTRNCRDGGSYANFVGTNPFLKKKNSLVAIYLENNKWTKKKILDHPEGGRELSIADCCRHVRFSQFSNQSVVPPIRNLMNTRLRGRQKLCKFG